MTLEERHQYLTVMLERHKARVYDLRKQIDHTEDLINALLGAMETITEILPAEKQTPDIALPSAEKGL
jgi:hypothetical protein